MAIESDIKSVLQFADLQPKHVAELASVLTKFQGKGIRPVRVFPIGIPAPDGIIFETILDARAFKGLIDLTAEINRFRHIEVFPLGIPVIDRYMVRANIR